MTKKFEEDSDITLADLIKKKGPLSDEELDLVRRWIAADWESHDIDRDAVTLIKRFLETCKRRE